jgi:putative nucleotidyltransferase with HDIG domain
MIKKIDVSDLQLGMFVSDFNCGWLNHPFLVNSMLIEDDDTMFKVKEAGIKELYIDTNKTVQLNGPRQSPVVGRVKAPKTAKKTESPDNGILSKVPMREEIDKARKVKTKATSVIKNALDNCRTGKDVEYSQIDGVVQEMVDSVFRNRHALTSLSRVKNQDEYTYRHSVNVAILMISLCRTMKMKREDIADFGTGVLLHDIGKMKVSRKILTKPTELLENEFEEMKRHVSYSIEILSETKGVTKKTIDVATQHHERFDGTGYPHGLRGDKISPGGQMGAIIDVYDALTSDRCYHDGMDPVDALKKIYEWSNLQFNPRLVQYYIRAVGLYPVGTLVRLESGYLGVVIQPGEAELTKPVVRVMYDSAKDWHVTPRDIDLSRPQRHGIPDRIVSTESPLEWKIYPLKYVDFYQ